MIKTYRHLSPLPCTVVFSVIISDYRVVVYNVFVERGNVAVLHCNIPANVRDFVEILAWWRQEGRERTEIHSGGRYLVTTSGTLAQPAMLGSGHPVNYK